MRVKRFASFLVLAILVICSISMSIQAATTVEKTTPAAVTGHTVSISGTVDLNYYLNIPNNYNAKNMRVVFRWGNKGAEGSLVKVNANGANYVAQCSLEAANMTDTVILTLLDKGDKVILTDSYRVVDYVDALALKHRDIVQNHDKYLQRALESLLVYGASAQKLYNYRTSDLADSAKYMKNIMTSSGNQRYSEITGTFKKDAEGIINSIYCDLLGTSIKEIGDDNIGLKFKSVAIDFNKATSAKFLFDVTDEAKFKNLKASYNGAELQFRKQGNSYYLEIKGVSPDLFDYGIMGIKIGSKTYKYMPIDYAANGVVDGGKLADISCAAYAYGHFTDLYVNNRVTELPDNGIPVVYLNIDESRGTIDDMIASSDHSVFCYGKMSIDVPEGFRYSDLPDNICKSLEGLSMSIRGRGNTTWSESGKKPFKIKLDKKADLFGLGSNKHWVLLANKLDSTLIKDRITAWLGDRMGFDFTPRGVSVDVVITGGEYGTQYLGSYYLSENVRVDSNRLDIDELKADDYDPQTITGGYLVQNGAQVRADSPDRFYTSRGANWATNTPSFDTSSNGNYLLNGKREDTFNDPELGDGYINRAQQQYIQNHIQHVEDVMYQGGTAYRELMDVESAAKYWMIQNFCLNNDAYATGSTYIYKERDVGGKVGKIYWGPLWDFDYAWTHNMIYTGFMVESTWIKPLICDRTEGGFIPEVMKQWKLLKPALEELIADGGIIDQYYAETKASAEADHRLNGSSDDFDYRAEVDRLKTWIRNRITWVDANIGGLGDYIHRVEFKVDGKLYAAEYLNRQDRIGPDYMSHPVIEGYTFAGWKDQDGNMLKDDIYITKDTVYTAVYLPDGEVTHGEDIVFENDHVTVIYNVHVSYYQIDYKVVPEDAIDKEVIWTSSDESYATVDENGLVHYNGVGEVRITGTLKNGVSRTFVLTVKEWVPEDEVDEVAGSAVDEVPAESVVSGVPSVPEEDS